MQGLRALASVIPSMFLELQNECECKKGFRGNGIDCESVISCLEQAEKCHPLVSYVMFPSVLNTQKTLKNKNRVVWLLLVVNIRHLSNQFEEGLAPGFRGFSEGSPGCMASGPCVMRQSIE